MKYYNDDWKGFKRAAFKHDFDLIKIQKEMRWTDDEIKEFFDINGISKKGRFGPIDLLNDKEFAELYMECDSDEHMADIMGCSIGKIKVLKKHLRLWHLDRKEVVQKREKENEEKIIALYLDGYDLDEIAFETSMYIKNVKKILLQSGELDEDEKEIGA